MKKCYKCQVEKPLECFSKNSHRTDGVNSQCKDCHKKFRRNHYVSNKQKIMTQVADRRKQCKHWVNLLKQQPCKDCGKNFPPYCMDFDHLHNKIYNVSYAIGQGWSKEKLMEEISKCDIVCANCHRIRTHNRTISLTVELDPSKV